MKLENSINRVLYDIGDNDNVASIIYFNISYNVASSMIIF